MFSVLGVIKDFLCRDGAPPWRRDAHQACFDTLVLCLTGSLFPCPFQVVTPPPHLPLLTSTLGWPPRDGLVSRSPAFHTRVATERAERDATTSFLGGFGGGGAPRSRGIFGGRGIWAWLLGGMGGGGGCRSVGVRGGGGGGEGLGDIVGWEKGECWISSP